MTASHIHSYTVIITHNDTAGMMEERQVQVPQRTPSLPRSQVVTAFALMLLDAAGVRL
jgi:hypothetical protein